MLLLLILFKDFYLKTLKVVSSLYNFSVLKILFYSGGTILYALKNGGVDLAPCHEACNVITSDIWALVNQTRANLASGKLSPGVEHSTGNSFAGIFEIFNLHSQTHRSMHSTQFTHSILFTDFFSKSAWITEFIDISHLALQSIQNRFAQVKISSS